MTSLPALEGRPSAERSSSEGPSIEVYLFHCGHGDTILVRLPDDRWGLNARRARDLLQGKPGRSVECEDLQSRLGEWDSSGQIQWRELSARFLSFVPRGYRDQIEFVPIGPDPADKRRIMTSDLRKLGTRPDALTEANELSLLIVLAVKFNDRTLNVLLGADAGVESVEKALDYWKQHARELGRHATFDAIKVPHHGSIKSHLPALCQMKRSATGAETAAISAGTRRALPDREVLRDYLANGWNVMVTTTKAGTSATSLPMMLSDRGKPDEGEVARHTIRLSWSAADGLSVEPAGAKIRTGDLAGYEMASVSA